MVCHGYKPWIAAGFASELPGSLFISGQQDSPSDLKNYNQESSFLTVVQSLDLVQF